MLVPAQRLPPPARFARLYSFWEMANDLGWGAPKHTPVMTYLYMFVSSRFVSFFSGSHGNGTSPPYPSTHTHTHDIRYTCPGSSSGLMTLNGSDGVPWPCHQPWYIYCHFLPIESVIICGLQCQTPPLCSFAGQCRDGQKFELGSP